MPDQKLSDLPERYILKPAPGRIAVRVEEAPKRTQAGLHLLTDSVTPKPTVGTVVEVCETYELENEEYEPLYKAGDVVIFGRFSGTKVKIGDDTFILLQESNILGRLVLSDSPEAVEVRKVHVQPPEDSE